MYDLASTLLSIAPTNADRKEHFVIGGIKESLVYPSPNQFSQKSYKSLGKKKRRERLGGERLL